MTDADAAQKIDLESIKDDIVEAVVVQLQSTANRPHLIKELATVLMQSLTAVQQYVFPRIHLLPLLSSADESNNTILDLRTPAPSSRPAWLRT